MSKVSYWLLFEPSWNCIKVWIPSAKTSTMVFCLEILTKIIYKVKLMVSWNQTNIIWLFLKSWKTTVNGSWPWSIKQTTWVFVFLLQFKSHFYYHVHENRNQIQLHEEKKCWNNENALSQGSKLIKLSHTFNNTAKNHFT